MKAIIKILLAAIIVTVFGCAKNWDDHYNKQPETTNRNVWDAIKERNELSDFAALMVQYKYDTLFLTNNTYTIFIPDNNAFAKYANSQVHDTTLLNYHISKHYIQPADIQGKRKLQTLAEKYSTFENVNGIPSYDGIPVTYESPLYRNGKFFIMDEVAIPRLNLYEYFAQNNPYLKTYIDKKDSIILNMEKSRPIGFDDLGNTVFDTVSIKMNSFEQGPNMFFPVSKEFRKWTATFVYPRLENYENALTAMALKLGGNFHDYKDIPVKWQEDVLIPHLLKHGTFQNMLEMSEFKTIDVLTSKQKYNMVNIQDDSIIVNYTPTEPYLCSNGLFYDYAKFDIPDSLFSGAEKIEGEWLARKIGSNRYVWRDSVKVTSSTYFDVANMYNWDASNDTILVVNFGKGYEGTFTLQFKTRNLFPGKYRMEIFTHMDIGGIYDIYVNNLLVRTFDYYDYVKYRTVIKSVDGIHYFAPTGRYNRFDCFVDNITEFGIPPTIRFEYKGPASGPMLKDPGLVIDVIKFIPVNN